MYESRTFEALLEEMLSLAPSNTDKSEGSLTFYSLAPPAWVSAEMYMKINSILNETYADTASRYYLIKRAKERYVFPYPATHAILQGEFNQDIPIGSRFSLEDLNYKAIEKKSTGVYKMECETAGKVGNNYLGQLIPIDYIPDLNRAELTKLLIPGEEEEETEHFRSRYFDKINTKAFGGNKKDYEEKVNAIEGVGGAKVICAWEGSVKPTELLPPTTLSFWLPSANNIPESVKQWLEKIMVSNQEGYLCVKGFIRIIILDSTYSKPTDTLIERVQTILDPEQNQGEGVGLAPIGHIVRVTGASETKLEIKFNITYKQGWDWNRLKPDAEQEMDTYFRELSSQWSASDTIVVRISQIENRLLHLSGVMDVFDTSINGETKNLVLDNDCIPIRGNVYG